MTVNNSIVINNNTAEIIASDNNNVIINYNIAEMIFRRLILTSSSIIIKLG